MKKIVVEFYISERVADAIRFDMKHLTGEGSFPDGKVDGRFIIDHTCLTSFEDDSFIEFNKLISLEE